jgi:hypothetical protein
MGVLASVLTDWQALSFSKAHLAAACFLQQYACMLACLLVADSAVQNMCIPSHTQTTLSLHANKCAVVRCVLWYVQVQVLCDNGEQPCTRLRYREAVGWPGCGLHPNLPGDP